MSELAWIPPEGSMGQISLREYQRLRLVEQAAREVVAQAKAECGLSNEASSLDLLRSALGDKRE